MRLSLSAADQLSKINQARAAFPNSARSRIAGPFWSVPPARIACSYASIAAEAISFVDNWPLSKVFLPLQQHQSVGIGFTAKGRPSGAEGEDDDDEDDDEVGAGGGASFPRTATSPKRSLDELALWEASAHKYANKIGRTHQMSRAILGVRHARLKRSQFMKKSLDATDSS